MSVESIISLLWRKKKLNTGKKLSLAPRRLSLDEVSPYYLDINMVFAKEANTGDGIKLPLWFRKYMSYILPLIITIVYIKGYYDTFCKQPLGIFIGWMCFAVLLVVIIYLIALLTGHKSKQQ